MSKAAVRGIAALVLLLTVAVRFQADLARRTMMTEFDASAAVAQVLRNHGLELRENPVKPPRVLSVVVYFQRPECDRVSLVLPYFINAEAEPLLARVTEPGFDRHFYYMDSSWQEQHRVSMFLAWAKYAALDLAGRLALCAREEGDRCCRSAGLQSVGCHRLATVVGEEANSRPGECG